MASRFLPPFVAVLPILLATVVIASTLRAGESAGHARLVQPNPFTSATTFELSMPKSGHATIVVYDMLGRHVRTLLDADVAAGNQPVPWDGNDESGAAVLPGVYLCVLSVDGAIVNTVKAVKVADLAALRE